MGKRVGQGAASEDENQPPTGDATGGTEPTASEPTAPEPNSGDGVTFSEEQQKHLDKLLADRLKRAKQKWQEDTDAAKAEADRAAEERRLESEREFEELANQRKSDLDAAKADGAEKQAKIDELEARRERLEAVLKAQLAEARKNLPDHIINLLDKLDVPDQLEWIAENAGQLKQANWRLGTPPAGEKKPAKGGTGRGSSSKGPLVNF